MRGEKEVFWGNRGKEMAADIFKKERIISSKWDKPQKNKKVLN